MVAADGTKPLTGIGVYFLRPTPSKPITEEIYYKVELIAQVIVKIILDLVIPSYVRICMILQELICGSIDNRQTGGLLRTIFKTLQNVYIPAILGMTESDTEADENVRTILRNRMIPGLRSFCSALSVLEATQIQNQSILQTEKVFTGYEQIEDIRRFAKTPEKVQILERTMTTWISTVSQIVAESFRLRKELDSHGPQDEVEYWKRRSSLLSMLEQKINGGEMKFTLLTLSLAGSPIVKGYPLYLYECGPPNKLDAMKT